MSLFFQSGWCLLDRITYFRYISRIRYFRYISKIRYSVWQTSARLEKGLMPEGHWWPWLACRILAKSEYWFERYCRATISAVFGIFHTHVIFKKIFCHSQKNFMGPKNHIQKKKYGVKIFLANWNFLANKHSWHICFVVIQVDFDHPNF